MVQRRNAGIVVAAGVGGLSVLVADPILFSYRLLYVAALIALAAIFGCLAVATRRWKTAALLAVSAGLVAWQGARPVMDRSHVIAETGADAIAIERHFIVGFAKPEDARDYIQSGHVGGLFLTQRNVRGLDAAALASMISEFQALRRTDGLPPLIVAGDQEGGPVSHLSPPLERPPALSSLAALGPHERVEAARQIGAEQGRALREVGVTMDLAPVSDLTPTAPSGPLDRHTLIGTRSISADPTIVAAVATGFSAGMLSQGVMPTAKHFPGLGRVKADTHLVSASLDTSRQALESSDWAPFRAVLTVPGTAIMLSHVALDAVDPGVPASQSNSVVTGILRRDWGFDGIAITDDLTMGAVEHSGLCRAVVGALNAGVDLLLVSWDTDKVFPALRCALDGLRAGALDRQKLERSARRLDAIPAVRPVSSLDPESR